MTHRWWGDKFCKRTCKNAYIRENRRSVSGQFFFTGGARLAAAVAVAAGRALRAERKSIAANAANLTE